MNSAEFPELKSLIYMGPEKHRGFYAMPPEVPQTLYDNMQDINRYTGGVTVNHRPTEWFRQRLVEVHRAHQRLAQPGQQQGANQNPGREYTPRPPRSRSSACQRLAMSTRCG